MNQYLKGALVLAVVLVGVLAPWIALFVLAGAGWGGAATVVGMMIFGLLLQNGPGGWTRE